MSDIINGWPLSLTYFNSIPNFCYSSFLIGDGFEGKGLNFQEDAKSTKYTSPCHNFWLHVIPEDGYFEAGSYLNLKFCNHFDSSKGSSTLTFNEKFGAGSVTQTASFGRSDTNSGEKWGITLFAEEGTESYQGYLHPWDSYFYVGSDSVSFLEYAETMFTINDVINGSSFTIDASNNGYIFMSNGAKSFYFDTYNDVYDFVGAGPYLHIDLQDSTGSMKLNNGAKYFEFDTYNDYYSFQGESSSLIINLSSGEEQVKCDAGENSFDFFVAQGFYSFSGDGSCDIDVNEGSLDLTDGSSTNFSVNCGMEELTFYNNTSTFSVDVTNKRFGIDSGGSSVSIDLGDLGSKSMYIREISVCEGSTIKKIKVLATNSY